MLSGGATVLSVLFLIRAETQLDIGGRIETMAGQAPTGIAVNSSGQTVPYEQGQLAVIATPELSLRYLSETDDCLATSSTRMLWRPVPLPHQRPLFLEMVDVSELGLLGKRTRWRLSLHGSYGEEDYTMLSQQFLSQPSLPTSLTAALVTTNDELSWRASRRTDLVLQLQGIFRRSIDVPTAPPGQAATLPGQTASVPTTTAPSAYGYAFPPQLTGELDPGIRHLLSRTTTLEAFIGLMDTDIGAMPPITHLNVLSLEPQLGVRYALTRHHQLHLSAGLAYTIALAKSPQAPAWAPVYPLVQVELTSRWRQAREVEWRSYLGVETDAFTDPVLGTEVLRGTAQARVDLGFGPHWGVGATAVFATDLSSPLQDPGTSSTALVQAGASPPLPLDETVVTAEVPFYYRRPNHYLVELGGRFTQRAPNLRSPEFAWRSDDRELWVFLRFSTLTAQVPRRPRPAAPTAQNPGATPSPEPPPLPPPVLSPL